MVPNQTFADFLLQYLTPAIVGITFCSFIFFLARLKSKTDRIHKSIKEAIEALPKDNHRKNFKLHFWDQIDDELIKNKVFSHNWREYRETLIDPDPTDPESNFKNSIQPFKFFSFEEILRTEINLRFFHSVPGKLTGLGVLGTFLGLALGIQSIGGTYGDSQKLIQGIDNLLSGAGAAFYTSIAGIISSILFSGIEKAILSKVENDFYLFLTTLEKCLEFQTKERIAEQALKEARKQTVHLANFSQDLSSALMDYVDTVVNRVGSQVIAPSFSSLIEEVRSLKEVQSNASEELLKDLANKMTGGLKENASAQFKSIETALESFQSSLPLLVSNMQSAQETMTNNNEALAKQFKQSMAESSTSVNNQVGELMSQMVSTVNNLVTSLSDQFSNQAKNFNNEITNSISSIEKNLDAISTRISNNQKDTSASLNNVIDNLKSSFEGFDDKILRFKETVGDSTRSNEIVNEMMVSYQRITDQHREVTNNLIGCTNNFGELRSSFSQNATSLNNLASELQKYSSNLNNSQKELFTIWENYKSRFEDIDESTKQMFQHIDQGLVAYQTRVNEFQEKLFTNVEKVSGAFAGAVSGLSDAIESLDDKKSA